LFNNVHTTLFIFKLFDLSAYVTLQSSNKSSFCFYNVFPVYLNDNKLAKHGRKRTLFSKTSQGKERVTGYMCIVTSIL